MSPSRRGFTLVEILIVVIILGILAAITVPMLGSAAQDARNTNLVQNLAKIRAQVQAYYHEHNCRYPTAEDFADQMTGTTNIEGQIGSGDDFSYGPYLEQMPANPITASHTVEAASDTSDLWPTGGDDGGWWYNEVNGRFYADLKDSHVDEGGNQLNRY